MDGGHPTTRSERLAVMLLCLLGAIHVFTFSAAFPFFGVVDEQAHFDMVMRYSHGDIPRSLGPPNTNSLPFLAIYGTPEYLASPLMQTNWRIPPPPWKQPIGSVREQLLTKEVAYQRVFTNYEAASPPLYYAMGGAWWRLGEALKLDGVWLLYWLRFMNVGLAAALVWIGWLAARKVFPENIFIHLAVPLLIAFLPQTSLYTINNDVLTPVTFGLAYFLLLKFFAADRLSPWLAAMTGLALAAAFLTKMSNLPLLVAATLFIALKFFRRTADGKLRESLFPALALALAAGLPMAAWMAWCQSNFGDLTGANVKIQFMGWIMKSNNELLAHPIFTSDGLWYFLKKNLATFWQGEMLWRRQPMTHANVDAAYVVLTLGALAFTLAGLLLRPPPFATWQRSALWLGFTCVFGTLLFLALISVLYDFQHCFYPSRKLPYFVSGRLMLGGLVPFMLLFTCGLDRLLKPFGYSTKFFLLLGLLGFMLGSEITTDWAIFSNEYNWFHL